jgi:hypothetical protein
MLAQNLYEINNKAGLSGTTSDPGELINKILPYVFGAAGIAILIYLVMGGLQLMLSRGDPKAMQAAQGKITNAFIGFTIIIVSFVLVRLIGQLLGISVFSQIFGGGSSGPGR